MVVKALLPCNVVASAEDWLHHIIDPTHNIHLLISDWVGLLLIKPFVCAILTWIPTTCSMLIHNVITDIDLCIVLLHVNPHYSNVLHWIVGLYYYVFLVNESIGLILVIQTFDPSTLSVLHNKDLYPNSSIVWSTTFPFNILNIRLHKTLSYCSYSLYFFTLLILNFIYIYLHYYVFIYYYYCPALGAHNISFY